ncbi:proton-conducting transporter transmembrane domain-containing protein [Halorussus ruber]|uniref:proton-conducting transporter transmembrane domain-containing protein n=1 Tax=Halorussus ruber TaxID=1126238 RepID=UPI001092216F|nr:proton-conducting transporter membrane subunit [Halorussus ruber]
MSALLLPALVALPVVGAALAVLAGNRSAGNRLAGWISGGTLAVQTLLAVALAVRVGDSGAGTVRTVLGGFRPAVGVELRADPLAALAVALFAVVALAAVWYANATAVGGKTGARPDALLLLLTAGLSGVALTADLFNLYVVLEITGLAAYALVALGERGSARAALRYLVVGTVGASLYLLGVAYLYISLGQLNISKSNEFVSQVGLSSPLVLTAFALAFVGLAVKIPLVPVHTWLPDAHARASVPASVVLSALVTTAGVYAFVKVLYGAFGVEFLSANSAVGPLISALGAASLLVGGALALRESKIKRVLAYSTVSQLGIVVVGVGLGSRVGLTGASVHLLGHAVTKAGLFFAAGLLALAADAKTVEEYAGIGNRAPVPSAAFALLSLGMIGVPPTVGFAGKWYVLVAAADAGSWLLVAAVLVSSLLSLAYFGRILARMYFAPPPDSDRAESSDAPTGSVGASGDSSGGPSGTVGAANSVRALDALPVVAALATVALGLSASALAQFLEPAISGLLA